MILKWKIPFLLVAVSIAAVGCSSSTPTSQAGDGGHGSGGLASNGGKTGSGGAGAGGTVGQGAGGASTGGNPATGGSSAPGGGSGRGGASGSAGGSTGEGGAAGSSSGGAGGAAGAAGSGGTTPASGGRPGTDAGTGADGPGSGGSGGPNGGAGGQSTTDASPSTGGSGGGYNPCKASPCVILPLGDSITHGFGSTDDAGYRSSLFKLVVAANQNVTFIGSLTNGPGTVSSKTFPSHHEGHDGISVSGITGWVPPAKAFTATPHIVLLHIGTNDMTSNADPTTTANQLDTLVSNLVKAAPDALIVVAKIIPLFYASSTYTTYAAKIPDIVSAHAAKNEHVVMADMSSFPSTDFGNGVHPSDQGYAYMANIWYQTIKGYLP